MSKIFLAKLLNLLPLLKLKTNLLLCSCTMRVFQLTENKPIYFVLTNVVSKKKLFSTTLRLRHASNLSYFHQRRKKVSNCFICFYFYLKGGNLAAALLACINDFVDKRTLDKMIQALKIFFFSFRPFPLVTGGNSVSSFSTSFCLQCSSPSHQLPPYLLLPHLKIFSLVSLFSSFLVTSFPSSFFLHTLGLSS